MKTVDYKLMGERIRKQRELLGYTREQLAEKLEVSSKFCSDIELGVKGMSMTTLARMSDILCMSVDYMLFGEQEEKSDLDTLTALFRHCPKKYRQNFITIARAFADSVTE
ncbi:MAG: helix-turn-helix domain-containing protein [Porcipelethomonas sp.]